MSHAKHDGRHQNGFPEADPLQANEAELSNHVQSCRAPPEGERGSMGTTWQCWNNLGVHVQLARCPGRGRGLDQVHAEAMQTASGGVVDEGTT